MRDQIKQEAVVVVVFCFWMGLAFWPSYAVMLCFVPRYVRSTRRRLAAAS